MGGGGVGGGRVESGLSVRKRVECEGWVVVCSGNPREEPAETCQSMAAQALVMAEY